MDKSRTSFQNKNYEEALNITKILFGYFSRMHSKAYLKFGPFARLNSRNSLSSYALSMAEYFWTLEGILEEKVKQPSGATFYID